MDIYKNVIVPEKTISKLDSTICDMCKKPIVIKDPNVDDIEISRRKGTQYRTDGSGKEYHVDICGKCFENELVPWLESKGVKMIEEYWDC